MTQCKCPKCSQQSERVTNFGFYKCQAKIVGKVVVKETKPVLPSDLLNDGTVNRIVIANDEFYHTFRDDKP